MALRLGLARLAAAGVRPTTLLRPMAQQAAVARRWASSGPEDNRMIGEYPDLPKSHAQTRDPYQYWDMQDRRNQGETLQENDDLYSMWVVEEVWANGRVSPGQAAGELALMLTLLAALLYGIAKLKDQDERNPVTPKAHPFQDKYEAAAISTE